MVSGIALCGVALGILGAALFTFDLATRPPCKPGYVRLVDLEPTGPFIALALGVIALVVFWRSRRGTHLAMWTGVGIAVLTCIALVDVGAVATLVHHHGARYDWSCWTF